MCSTTEKILIQANPEIANLIPGYLENRRKDIARMRKALDIADFETIMYIGHSMRGSGQGYGFDHISDIGLRLETAARNNNGQQIGKQIDALLEYLQNINVVYE